MVNNSHLDRAILSIVINNIKAKNMLTKGYMVHVVQKLVKVVLGIKDTLVVQEYFDIFLNNLPRLALERKLEFSIELAPVKL